MMRNLLITAVLALVIIAPARDAYAVGGIIGCGSGAAASGAVSAAHAVVAVPVSDLITETNTGTSVFKDCVLDPLAFALAEGVISSLIRSVTDWVNNGFEGGPTFVTDPQAFLGEIADNTALDFIEGTELGFLCSPFALEVRIALAVDRQPFRDRIRCSLGDVSDNIEGFLSGDFSQGGWPAWFRVHTRLQNNPFGAQYLAKAELSARIASRQRTQEQEWNWSGGFFSKKKCVEYKDVPLAHAGAGATSQVCARSEIVTPGTQINEQLNNALGSGLRRLELADEFDELVNALLSQLAQQALTSIDGLRGLSSRSSSSAVTRTGADGSIVTSSYLDTLVNETENQSIDLAQDALLNDIESALTIEEEYQNTLDALIDNLERAEEELGDLYECYIDITQNPASVTGISGVNALAEAQNASSTNAVNVQIPLETYSGDLEQSLETTERLITIRTQARSARTVEELNAAADSYDAILSSGVIHSTADLRFLQGELASQEITFAALVDRTEDALRTCRAF